LTLLDQIRVVLVEPEHPGNIGAAARAMKTMGLHSLHVVNPARFPDPQADWRAAGAIKIIESATVHEKLDSAIEDCGYVVGTSARARYVPIPLVTAQEFGELLKEGIGTDLPIAILFGRETNGLSNEELQRCNRHIRIPASEDYKSLNLAMAVQVVAYEVFKSCGELKNISKQWDREYASAGDVELMTLHLEKVCDEIGYFREGRPRHAMVRFRRMFNRLELDETEVKLLRGFLNHVERSIEKPTNG